jgi:Rrf2 family iron-sulfur cluster assembly transcriptional regulator
LKDERISLKAIAEEISSPVVFTAKIMQLLVRNKTMYSIMGPTGAFKWRRIVLMR